VIQDPSKTFTLSTAYFGFRNMTPANYFSTAAALGIRHVEVPLYTYTLDRWFGRVDTAYAVDLAAQCGVRMVAAVANLGLAPPFDTQGRPLSVEAAKTNCEIALRVIDIAVDLGLEVIRIAEPAVDAENQHFAEQYMTDYGTALRPIGDYAGERGIRIALENYGITIDQMDLMLSTADHKNVGTLFDPCNYARMGLDPVEAVRRFKNRIVYCHLKDTAHDESRPADELFTGSRYRPSLAVGDGDIDWSSLLPELASGYQGYASIEYENDLDVVAGTRRSIAFLAQAGHPLTSGPPVR